MNIEQRYLTLNQAAVYLGLSPRTLYKWAERDQIPAYKIGRVWRLDRDELDRFVKASGSENQRSNLPLGYIVNESD